MTAAIVPLTDEAAEYLLGVLNDHVPNEYGWCKCCGRQRCGRRWAAAVELAIAGRLEIPPPWAVRPDLGRWP